MSRPTTPIPQAPTQANTASFTSLPRSSTHPVKPRHHIPHHPHRTHHHRHRHHDVSVPQSAIQPTTSNPFSDVISRTTAKALDGSKPPSLEQRQQQQQQQQAQTELAKEQAAKDEADREQAKWVEVEKKRTKRKAVDEDLLHTLTHLSTLSTTTTRRLDYTYYSLLSSISSLHSTLSLLHTLSLSLSTYTSTFHGETHSLTTDLSSQLTTTNQTFEAQAKRILGLEQRIRRGRERKEDLSGRLGGVRERVEGVVRREGEGERRVGRWMRWLWGGLVGWVVLGLVVVVVRGRGGGEGRDEGAVELGRRLVGYGEVGDGRGNGSWEGVGNGEMMGGKVVAWEGEERQEVGGLSTSSVTMRSAAPRGSSVDAEATLRLFDEL